MEEAMPVPGSKAETATMNYYRQLKSDVVIRLSKKRHRFFLES